MTTKGKDLAKNVVSILLKKKQKIFEIIGNEGARIGGKRKMKPFQTGLLLSKRILKELGYLPK